MKKSTVFFFVAVVLVFMAACTLFWGLRTPEIDEIPDFAQRIPLHLSGGYSGRDIPLEERIYAMLQTRNVIMRFYSRPGEPDILFYFIFDKSTYKTSDPPENCVQGAGYSVVAKNTRVLSIPYQGGTWEVPVNVMPVQYGPRQDMYIYWFLAGTRFYGSYIQQRKHLIGAYLRCTPTSGGQVRISTEVQEGDQEEALQRLQRFMQEIVPFIIGFLH